ncbi:iron chelate uptake ABC transporter family permease subunit [Pseudorhodobacter sp. MZDSW-24AT]|uniref:iron chelate uptake ABC transporter family permease subunit n=1 Tax=Pseudorhodobacter sp. MZDSW-24AT TaxID=2052957 RepID=UPI000C1F73F3|nr:iron chelate uptake ABC transporter family permease subunit [Pseudorhodobacter sp. MZDSW-24AT]PJF08814.1 enterobactin ABC transporter permease [Pseudorhodobacter sp. MZDSW-24AT]
MARYVLLGLALLASAAVYLLPNLGAKWEFVLALRATRLAGLVLVGIAIAVATVLFQTVARNRILTPQIMGLDALFIFLQTALVAGLGPIGFAALSSQARFGLEVALLIGAALLLFGTLLGRGAQDVPRMILTGVILGVLFRSLSGFLARVMDPNAFVIVQAEVAASFSRVNAGLLPVAALATLAVVGLALWLAPRLDVLALGRPAAVSLGLAHDRLVLIVLALVAVLVAVATALVGPLSFLGLLVAALARPFAGTDRHLPVLISAMMLAALMLVAGQTLFERALGQQSTLPAVVEFAGGLVFLFLLLRGRIR